MQNKALQHHKDMERLYEKEIAYSVMHSKTYRNSIKLESKKGKVPEIIVTDRTTDEAVDDGCCALNFASYWAPGGGFMQGMNAQEEALCHHSTLYEILTSEKLFKEYLINRKDINNGMYYNWAIYSPKVIFDEYAKVNVITCAAPNLRRTTADEKTVYNTLDSRIKFILDVAEANNQKHLILGAFGCGVFLNDPGDVASLFKKYLMSGKYNFDLVDFAIPGGPNYLVFNEIFS